MKRDMDLVRRILISLETRDSGYADGEFQIEGYTDEQVGFHVHLMVQAGLVDGIDISTRENNYPFWSPSCMTWGGYDFLDSARNDTFWNKAKVKIKELGGSVAFSTLSAYLKKLAADGLGIS